MQKLRPRVRSVSRTHPRPRRRLHDCWFILPLITIAIFGLGCDLGPFGEDGEFREDVLGGITATADGAVIIGVTSSAEFTSFRGMLLKVDADGAILWRRILRARYHSVEKNSLTVGGVAESPGGEIIVSVKILDLFSIHSEVPGLYLYKFSENGNKIWDRKLELENHESKLHGGLPPPISVHSSGAVIVNMGSALVVTDEDANVLWENDGDVDVVMETILGDIITVGNREDHIVARRFDIQGNVLWDRELLGLNRSFVDALSIAESPVEEFLILVEGGLLIDMDAEEARATENTVLLVIDGDGNVLEIREDEAIERATSAIVANNADIIVVSEIGLIRLDPLGAEVWRNEDSSVQAVSGYVEKTALVEATNGDILVANKSVFVPDHHGDVLVTRVTSGGDILFSRIIDGEGNGGIVMP